MDDEIQVPFSVPLDSDGFLRRECPTCERQFKWFSRDGGDPDAASVDQYFCPLCGASAGTDAWWTQGQLEYAQGIAGPQIDQFVQDSMTEAFRGLKNIEFKPDRNFSLDSPTSEPLHEPDDMVIVEPPCHPSEPVKVPEESIDRIHCLICGEPYAS